jgi:hypothetical protein
MTFTPPFIVTGRKIDDEPMSVVGTYPTKEEAVAKAEELYDDGNGWFATIVEDSHHKNVEQFGT